MGFCSPTRGTGGLRHRRSVDSDVHPGTVDLQTVRLPIKIINLNNGYLGMVRQWQEMFYSSRYSESYVTSLPDFVKLAESYGHVGMKIERPEDVEPALKKAFTEHKNDPSLHGLHRRSSRQRLSHGGGRQGPDRNDSGRRPV